MAEVKVPLESGGGLVVDVLKLRVPAVPAAHARRVHVLGESRVDLVALVEQTTLKKSMEDLVGQRVGFFGGPESGPLVIRDQSMHNRSVMIEGPDSEPT